MLCRLLGDGCQLPDLAVNSACNTSDSSGKMCPLLYSGMTVVEVTNCVPVEFDDHSTGRDSHPVLQT